MFEDENSMFQNKADHSLTVLLFKAGVALFPVLDLLVLHFARYINDISHNISIIDPIDNFISSNLFNDNILNVFVLVYDFLFIHNGFIYDRCILNFLLQFYHH